MHCANLTLISSRTVPLNPWRYNVLFHAICECELAWKTDVIKWKILRWEDYPGFFSWALNAMARVLIGESPYRRESEGDHMHTEEKEMRWCRDVVTSQRMPAATRRWKIKERILSQSLQRECVPTDTMSSEFWPLELWGNTYLLF